MNYMNYIIIFHYLPKKIAVSNDMLSNYCQKIADKYEIKVGNVKELILNLGYRTNYVVH